MSEYVLISSVMFLFGFGRPKLVLKCPQIDFSHPGYFPPRKITCLTSLLQIQILDLCVALIDFL